jgi:twitching motility two-component system response regulator PilH
MKNILIVDDDSALLVILSEAFCSSGQWCNVLTARSGAEAQKVLERVPVDFVLTDLDMPEMDGYELLENLKADVHTMPVIVITADIQDSTREKIMQRGAHAVMNWSMRFVSSLYVSAWGTAEIVSATLLALWIFGEVPGPTKILGGAIVMAGLLYYNYHENDTPRKV